MTSGATASSRRSVDEELHPVPGRRCRVTGAYLCDIVRRRLRRIQRRLERLLEELLDAGWREGQDHAHRLRAVVPKEMPSPDGDIHEIPGAGHDYLVTKAEGAVPLEQVERLIL